MPLSYILRRFAQRTGLSCSGDSFNVDDKQFAVDLINEVSKQLWLNTDINGSMEECIISVLDKQQITIPSFVGTVRDVRQYGTMVPWSLSDIRPRYHRNSWAKDSVRNWRVKGIIPIARDVTNSAPPTAILTAIDNEPVELTITGSTEQANSVSETIICNQLTNSFTKSFTSYTCIKKNKVNGCDILVQDADGYDLSLIYNNELEAYYQLIDAGSIFADSAQSISIQNPLSAEVLYKKRFYPFAEDNDEFPVRDFDDVILQKALAQWYADKDHIEKAAGYEKFANDNAKMISGDKSKGQDLQIEFQETGHQGVFRNLRRSFFRRASRFNQ
jgi:hypothetical protein